MMEEHQLLTVETLDVLLVLVGAVATLSSVQAVLRGRRRSWLDC